MDLEYQLSVICKDLQSLAEEEEEEDVALSLTSSPQLQRTDRPITRFLPPKDVSAIRRASTDGRVQGLSERRSLELCYRRWGQLSCDHRPVKHQAFLLSSCDLWTQRLMHAET